MRDTLAILALLVVTVLATDAHQNHHRPILPDPITAAAGNAAAERILAHGQVSAADSRRLCAIALGMVWSDIDPALHTFLSEEGCY